MGRGIAAIQKPFSGLTANVFLFTLASLFSDISTEMLYPVLPLFLAGTLGATGTVVGVIDGLAQAVQHIVQGLSGWISDQMGRRKPVALFGYVLSAVSKPLIGLSTNAWGVLGARTMDRLGSGTRSAPRDALIASSVDDRDRGKAFGLEGFGDNFGAFLGPLVALALLAWFTVDFRTIFFLAVIPGGLAVLMVLFVREVSIQTPTMAKLDLEVGKLPKAYWTYLAVVALFGVGNSSNMFLILRTSDLGASQTMTILIYTAYNLVAALASYPAGRLSDTWGRKPVLLIAFIVFALVYAGFGFTTNVVAIGMLFVLYGVYQGIFRAVGKAMATDFLPSHLRATGIGWYMAVVGLSELVASIVGGILWDQVGPSATFLYGACFAALGGAALALLIRAKK